MAEKNIQDLINVMTKENKISDAKQALDFQLLVEELNELEKQSAEFKPVFTKAAKFEKDALDIKIQESKINLEKLNVAKTAKSDAVIAINAQKQVLETMKESIEAQGGIAEDNKKYQEETKNLQIQEIDARLNVGGLAKGKEEELKKERDQLNKNNLTLLEKISSGIMGLKENAKEKLKGAGKGFMALVKGTLFAGALIAFGLFVQSPMFKTIIDNLDKILIGLGVVVGLFAIFKIIKFIVAITTALKAIKAFYIAQKLALTKTYLPPLKAMVSSMLATGKTMALTAKQFLTMKIKALKGFLPAVSGMVSSMLATGKTMARTAAQFLMMKIKALVAFLPAVTAMAASFGAMMIPLLPIIAIVAGIVVVILALKSAFTDFQKTLEETGSVAEALKVGIAKFMGFIIGFIPDLVLKLVGFVAGLFGFDDFKAKVGKLDPIQFIADGIKSLFDAIGNFFSDIFNFDYTGFLKGIPGVGKVLSFLGMGDDSKDQPLEGRAEGGSVGAGQPYVVGERGQELFVPSQPGQIVNAQRTAEMMKGGSGGNGGGSTSIVVAPNNVTSSTNTTNNSSTVSYIGNPDPIFQRASSYAI